MIVAGVISDLRDHMAGVQSELGHLHDLLTLMFLALVIMIVGNAVLLWDLKATKREERDVVLDEIEAALAAPFAEQKPVGEMILVNDHGFPEMVPVDQVDGR